MAQFVTSVDEPAESCDSDLESQDPEDVNKSMSVADVVSFLRKHGIPEQFCEAFEGK